MMPVEHDEEGEFPAGGRRHAKKEKMDVRWKKWNVPMRKSPLPPL